ncbi:hypothetical protein [Yoonia sp. 2307UL14-13]|uniref:hypothetical protein n=1 Tax=Yoonia sp. 2307UL14-13 TaxID=3126506 RepID=UPI0030A705D5
MDLDVIFVIGLIIGAFSIPAMINAFSDGRWPRGSFVALVIGGAMVGFAAWTEPATYTFAQVDDVFVSVLARFLN